MKNYIVVGTYMEGIYEYHATASSPVIAAALWQKAFPDKNPEALRVSVYEVAKDDASQDWCGNGHRYESGGYKYVW